MRLVLFNCVIALIVAVSAAADQTTSDAHIIVDLNKTSKNGFVRAYATASKKGDNVNLLLLNKSDKVQDVVVELKKCKVNMFISDCL